MNDQDERLQKFPKRRQSSKYEAKKVKTVQKIRQYSIFLKGIVKMLGSRQHLRHKVNVYSHVNDMQFTIR